MFRLFPHSHPQAVRNIQRKYNTVGSEGPLPSLYRANIAGRDSSVGTATRYGLDGLGIESWWGARFSAPVQTAPGAHPASYTMGTGSFPGVKRPGSGVDHPPLSSAEVEEIVQLKVYSTSGPSWPVLGWTLPFISCSHHKVVSLTKVKTYKQYESVRTDILSSERTTQYRPQLKITSWRKKINKILAANCQEKEKKRENCPLVEGYSYTRS